MTAEQSGLLVHTAFDALAWAAAASTLVILRRTWFRDNPVGAPARFGYLTSVLIGAGAGAWVFGTLNGWLSGQIGLARSIEGALAGAILSIEIWKKANGITVRTGAVYALPVALGIAVGRIGCLLAGLDDFTYGVPTGGDWGWDFGDGIPRHPVQLYESVAMAGFAAIYVIAVRRGFSQWKRDGFYLCVGFYAVQRFALEFLKPYQPAFLSLTVFQLLALALFAYALVMLATADRVEAAARN